MSAATAPDVIGTAEVVEITGLTKARISQLRKAGKMPPAAELACGPVWRRKHIESWAAARRLAN